MSAVTKQEKSQVPDLFTPPPLDLDASDGTFPSIKMGQDMSKPVQRRLVDRGDLYSQIGQDDPTPVILAKQGERFKAHVLTVKRGKSAKVDGKLERFDFRDPAAEQQVNKNGKKAPAWVTWTYTMYVPGIEDSELPHRFLITRTGKPTAQQINNVLLRNADKPAWVHAFEFWTETRHNAEADAEYFVVKAAIVEARADDVDAAGDMFLNIVMNSTQVLDESYSASEEPSI